MLMQILPANNTLTANCYSLKIIEALIQGSYVPSQTGLHGGRQHNYHHYSILH